jgi:tRNA A-37 threonylcarbamoyl transferase component Bud32
MEPSKNYNHGQFSSMDSENQEHGQGQPSQGFPVTHAPHINPNVRPIEIKFSENKPVLNFSIQTGEEFSLEFMRDRVNPRKPFPAHTSGDPSHTTNYSEIKGLLGISQTGSESGSGVSMVTNVEKNEKVFDRKNSSMYDNKSNYGSLTSVPRTSSNYGSNRGSSPKIKVLCSFGGKILPRPSDGKLRYVGGDTRILRIDKDISWQDLWQKTIAIYNQARAIKYQLPGEDLDALVSVSCDEDLQNMMEECNVIGDEELSKKLRMFLFSLSDLDESQFGLADSTDNSEIQYVVAVNGMDMGSRRESNLTGLVNSSTNNLDELDGQNTGGIASFNAPSSQPTLPTSSSAYETESQFYQGQMTSLGEPKEKENPLPYGSEPRPSDYVRESSNVQSFHSVVSQQGGLTTQHVGLTEAIQDPPIQEKEVVKPTGPVQKVSENENSLSLKNENPTSSSATQGELKIPIDTQENVPVSLPHDVVNRLEVPKQVDENLQASVTLPAVEYADSETDLIDLGFLEAPVPPQRVFYSERIPRHQAELLNRFSKSDDSLGSQILLTHSHSDIVQKDSIIESVENLHSENLDVQPEEKTVVTTKKLADPPIAEDEHIKKQRSEAAQEPTHEDTVKNSKQNQANKNTTVDNATHLKKNDDESASNVARAERGDILIDINDRFPSDFISDIFSKANFEDISVMTQLQRDGAGLSMNLANHEPKRWSFFQKLAGDEFSKKDVSLMDQDHISFSSELPNVEEEVLPPYKFTLTKNGVSSSQIDDKISEVDEEELTDATDVNTMVLNSEYTPSQLNYSEALQFNDMVENRVPDSEYEDQIRNIGLPLLDPSLGDLDINSLQIIKNEDLEELRELGSGTFGTVYHGKWRGTDVAIKRIKKSCFAGRSSEQERLTIEFWREADILSKLHHPNVVAFYGVVQDGPGGTLATVAEFMVDGSLRHVLVRKDRQLDHRKRLIIAMDAAFGMEYLHSKNIVHFDLKCDNLLVNLKDPSRPICKVADFGLSKIKRNTLVSGGVRGTLPWMAPELLNGSSNKVSEKVDVFSFGIVLWEILTGEEPYANMHYGAIIGGIVNNTLRPNIPNGCDPEWRRLMELCWAPNPVIRPTFTDITRRLRVMSAACHKPHKPST